MQSVTHIVVVHIRQFSEHFIKVLLSNLTNVNTVVMRFFFTLIMMTIVNHLKYAGYVLIVMVDNTVIEIVSDDQAHGPRRQVVERTQEQEVVKFLRPLDLPRIDRLDVRPYWAQLLPIRYVVYPGHVVSRNDGDRHYISAQQLMFLYEAHPDECVVVQSTRDALGRRDVIRALMPLLPDYYGRYVPPQRAAWRD